MQMMPLEKFVLSSMLVLASLQVSASADEREVDQRYELAKKYIHSQDFAKATEEYVWLWKNIEKEAPAMLGVRGSFMISSMHELARRYEPARKQFSELRDYAQTHDRSDWVSLNSVLEEDNKTLAWFDHVKNDKAEAKTVGSIFYLLEPLLAERKRWADMALLYPNPMSTLEHEYEIARESPICNRFPQHAAMIYTALLAAGRDSEAEQIAKRSIQLQDSKEMRGNLLMCAAIAKETRPNQLVWINECEDLEKSPSSAKSYYTRGLAYEKYRQWEPAIEQFKEAIKRDPKFVDAYFECGRADRALNRLEAALKDFGQAIRLDNSNKESLGRRAGVYISLNQYEAGLQDALAALKLDPSYSPAYNLKGLCELRQKNYDSSVRDFSKAIQLESQYPDAFYNRALAYMGLRQFDRAIADLDQCIALDPERTEAIECRARINFDLGKYEESVRDCSTVIELQSQNAKAFYDRALAYEKLGKGDLAESDREKAHMLGYKPGAPE